MLCSTCIPNSFRKFEDDTEGFPDGPGRFDWPSGLAYEGGCKSHTFENRVRRHSQLQSIIHKTIIRESCILLEEKSLRVILAERNFMHTNRMVLVP